MLFLSWIADKLKSQDIRQNRQIQSWLSDNEYAHIQAECEKTARRIKKIPNRIKATKAQQLEPEKEVEDNLKDHCES